MDNRRLFLAIAISAAILFGFQILLPRHTPQQQVAQQMAGATPGATASAPSEDAPRPVVDPAFPGNHPDAAPPPASSTAASPRLDIAAPRVFGSLSLRGARLDTLSMRDYHETVDDKSPNWPLLIPRGAAEPTWVQFGWSADQPGVALPGADTLWTASAAQLTDRQPVTLTWDNGAGLTFGIDLSIDDNYMFGIRQFVRNAGAAPVSLHPWARVRRDYTPVSNSNYLLHEGPIGVVDGRVHEVGYAAAKKADKDHNGIAYSGAGAGGWAGITDKYMLTAIVPAAGIDATTVFRHLIERGSDRYQVDTLVDHALVAPPGGEAAYASRLFAGAKEVRLLSRYETEGHIALFSYAVDFGWSWFLTKPIFYALDWLSALLGNFGLAILAFTVFVKILFFPLANKSYHSMGRMKVLGPRMTALRKQYEDDPARQQQEMLALYKTEGVNPAAGCLPMLVQIPVFFSLYKVIYVTIEMWHAPFYGWIKDLSVTDPTNVFTLFGLIPYDPTQISPLLHLGIWPLIMGATMVVQQRLNPPPPDPVQARLFQFMPVVFTFMLGRFPAGLVIYWSWNNLLTIAQQWMIQRNIKLLPARPPKR